MAPVIQFFTHQSLHLRYGRFDLMAMAYAVPLVVMLPTEPNHVAVLDSQDAIQGFFISKFDGLADAGIDYLRARASLLDTSRPGRHQAKVTWDYVDEDGRRAGATHAIYYLARRSGGLRVEMIEFEHLAFPAIADWVRQNESRHRRPQTLH